MKGNLNVSDGGTDPNLTYTPTGIPPEKYCKWQDNANLITPKTASTLLHFSGGIIESRKGRIENCRDLTLKGRIPQGGITRRQNSISGKDRMAELSKDGMNRKVENNERRKTPDSRKELKT